jgi:hypothetical protein
MIDPLAERVSSSGPIRKKMRPRPLCPLDGGRGRGRECRAIAAGVGRHVRDLAVSHEVFSLGRGTIRGGMWTCVDVCVVESFRLAAFRRRLAVCDHVASRVVTVGRRPPVSSSVIGVRRAVSRAWQRSPSPLRRRPEVGEPRWRSRGPSVFPGAPGGWCLTALQHQLLTPCCLPSRWNYLSHCGRMPR